MSQVGERIQEQIATTIFKETVQQRTDEQIVAVAAPCAATASPAPPMSMIGHAMLTPVQEIPELQVLERIQEQIVETISQENIQQRVDEQTVVVRVPTAQEQRIIPDIPRAQVVKRIRGKRAHQRTVEQNVRAPVPVQEQSFVPEKPGAQGEEQMPKSLDCRTLADLRA